MAVTFIPAEPKQLDIAHKVRMSKEAERELNEKVTRKHIDTFIAGVNSPARVKQGWNVTLIPFTNYSPYKKEYNYGSADSTYTYYISLDVTCKPDRERPNMEAEFQNLLNSLEQKAKFPGKWKIESVDGEPYVKKNVADLQVEDGNIDIGYGPFEIPEDWESFFDDLYGLDAHISRIKRALEGSRDTGWKKRLHCVLIGPPGCGKSNICQLIKEALGDHAVLEFDATSTTMAGAQKELAEREELPRVLLVEEIEKADEKALSWMLSLMDLRGNIKKVTARGNIMKDTKMICIATVNDMAAFQKIASGALYSRFANRIHFNRPDRELLGRILEREVRLIRGGKMEWIQPTIDLAVEIDTSDPREVISLMLCGRDSLLDGSFQQEYRFTSLPVKESERNNGAQ